MATKKKSATTTAEKTIKVEVAAAPRKRAVAKQPVRVVAAKKKASSKKSRFYKRGDFDIMLRGAVVGAVAVKYLQSDHGKELVAKSEFVKDNGMGPYIALAGYGVKKFGGAKYAAWGEAAMLAGAFLWGSKKMNAQTAVEADRVRVEGPSLEELAEADRAMEQERRRAEG